MSIMIELPAAVEAALKADAEAQGRDMAAIAVERLTALYAPEPPSIEEGSPEEDAALNDAEHSSFHPFDADALHEKLRKKYRLA